MLLFKHNKQMIEAEAYQARLDQHQKNARACVKDTGIIYDAICLAQDKRLKPWSWQNTCAEKHPAITKLCHFWEGYQGHESVYDARVPYVQLFLGSDRYVSLSPCGPSMPLVLDDHHMQRSVKASSVIFGDAFLVTFLAGREITALHSKQGSLVHYTVHNQALLQETSVLDEVNNLVFDVENQVAWQTLQGLRHFPERYPKLWQQLNKQHEVSRYEVL
jgi:hypothetical protein